MKSHCFIVILGPTASGKTNLGVKLAKKFHGVVLSADSRQVYRGMDIGTAKIRKQDMHGVPHYLLDIASPNTTFTVAQFQRAAQRIVKTIPYSTPVFIVGGSPFYIEAVLNPLPFPRVVPNRKLRIRLEQNTAAQLFAMLQRKDARRAAAIDPRNKRRLIRALEIVQKLGNVPYRSLHASPCHVLKLGIALPRQKLYERIDRRVDCRAAGILTEIRKLHRKGISWKRMEQFGLEYRWGSRIARHLIGRADGIQRLKYDIHGFCRRQLTWWRRDSAIQWITAFPQAERRIKRFLRITNPAAQ